MQICIYLTSLSHQFPWLETGDNKCPNLGQSLKHLGQSWAQRGASPNAKIQVLRTEAPPTAIVGGSLAQMKQFPKALGKLEMNTHVR